MSARIYRNNRGWSQERSPLRPGRKSTSYGSAGQVPGQQPPPAYSETPGYSGGGYQEIHAPRRQRDPSPFHPATITKNMITRERVAKASVLFVLVAQLAAFVFFYDLPAKIGRYNEAMVRMSIREDAMRKEAEHLEGEHIALRRETTLLEDERVALESSTRRISEERRALESAIRQSEQERSRLEKQNQLVEAERLRLEKQTHLLKDERQSLEKEELKMREERERWEKARDELTIPKGAFWEIVEPAWDCRAYGKREYWGILRNVPEGRSDMDACLNMPVEIKGVTVRRPYRCEHRGPMNGFWMVDWDQPDCKPWHQSFFDKGCTNRGSGLRQIEAEVVGINDKGGQDWRLLCETTPMIWNHINHTSPAHCEDRGKKIAVWYVPDDRC